MDASIERLSALIFAPSWPPTRSPRATMNHRVLPALGWRGDVWVAGHERKPAEEPEPPPALTVHRLGVGFDALLFNQLERLHLGLSDLPDRYVGWALRATLPALLRSHRKRPDLMVSISKPDSAHLPALAVRRRHPDLPWLAVFSDPWVDLELYGYRTFNAVTRRVNRWLEEWVVSEADAIVVTNAIARRLLVDRYAAAGDKSEVVSQCFDPALYPERRARSDGPALIRHLGDFYGDRSPRPLLEAVRRLHGEDPHLAADWRFELIGKLECRDRDTCVRLAAASPVVELLPEVPYQRSLDLMVGADALVVVDAPATVSPFLPSKLIDYLGANRPILALTPPGAAADLVREAGGLVAEVESPQEVDAVLRRLLQALRRCELDRYLPREAVRERYTKARVVEQMAQVVRSLTR